MSMRGRGYSRRHFFQFTPHARRYRRDPVLNDGETRQLFLDWKNPRSRRPSRRSLRVLKNKANVFADTKQADIGHVANEANTTYNVLNQTASPDDADVVKQVLKRMRAQDSNKTGAGRAHLPFSFSNGTYHPLKTKVGVPTPRNPHFAQTAKAPSVWNNPASTHTSVPIPTTSKQGGGFAYY